MRSKAILVGLVLAFSIGSADASDQTVILGFICATYESARQVALEQSWQSPESMPGDCQCMFGMVLEKRFAEIIEIIEVLRIGENL